MLSDFALMCYEGGIREFGALPIGDEQFETLSPKAKTAFSEMLATIRELQARVAELEEVERKAIAQSEYIQSHGLTEYEMARLKARVEELEPDATLGRLVREGDLLK
jgi:hypothetical protein